MKNKKLLIIVIAVLAVVGLFLMMNEGNKQVKDQSKEETLQKEIVGWWQTGKNGNIGQYSYYSENHKLISVDYNEKPFIESDEGIVTNYVTGEYNITGDQLTQIPDSGQAQPNITISIVGNKLKGEVNGQTWYATRLDKSSDTYKALQKWIGK